VQVLLLVLLCMKRIQKNEARKLRQQGMSMRDIAEKLGVSKSSVSSWTKDIVLSEEQLANLSYQWSEGRRKGCEVHSRNAKERNNKYKQEGYKLANINKQFAILCALYWGEGSKTKTLFVLANSDAKLLRYAFNWSSALGTRIR
jgi:predicted DNA-binding protein YlxM (UPF0122 family)